MKTKKDTINKSILKHIELKPVEWLKPYEGNARTHPAEQLDQIAASITEFGFVNPILAQADGTIIAGHGRLESATTRLKMKEVPVIVLDHLTQNQARLLVLADNKIALNAGWDEEKLADELQALEMAGAELELTGFDSKELDEYLGHVEEENEMPPMEQQEKPAFQQVTFTLHNKQADKLAAALRTALKGLPKSSLNENSNGNALYKIVEVYLTTIKENKAAEPKPEKTKGTKKKK